MKPTALGLYLSAAVFGVALLAGCGNPVAPATGGSISIQIGNTINTRTLLPSLNMTAESYTVEGSGPSGSSFHESTGGGSLTVEHLAFGDWKVKVEAVNSAGTVIGRGQAGATVQTGGTAALTVTVAPLPGEGDLALSVSWPAAEVASPSIAATLTPATGSPIDLHFDVSSDTASFAGSTIPAGYSTLTLQLLDRGVPVMGAVEVARVVAGQTTSGTYCFKHVNDAHGTIEVNITPALADPIPVTIEGVPATTTPAAGFEATAAVGDGTTNVVYVWYLNGASVATGRSYTLPGTTAEGSYRLDVTAVTADESRGGSATVRFQVTSPAATTIDVVVGRSVSTGRGEVEPSNPVYNPANYAPSTRQAMDAVD